MLVGCQAGSSPLTRGKHGDDVVGSLFGGLIPAHAGKTLPWRPPRPDRRAHPRSRGENDVADEVAHEGRGSSPLTRGKRSSRARLTLVARLIPAHAGKTQCRPLRRRGDQAHPRSRGENPHLGYVEVYAQGSSPLTRGKPHAGAPALPRDRLIPAHAGKTRTARART